MKSFKNIDAKSVEEAVELLVKLGREAAAFINACLKQADGI